MSWHLLLPALSAACQTSGGSRDKAALPPTRAAARVGWVSRRGFAGVTQHLEVRAAPGVGLRDEAANPTYETLLDGLPVARVGWVSRRGFAGVTQHLEVCAASDVGLRGESANPTYETLLWPAGSPRRLG
jgi:hypothetical protein